MSEIMFTKSIKIKVCFTAQNKVCFSGWLVWYKVGQPSHVKADTGEKKEEMGDTNGTEEERKSQSGQMYQSIRCLQQRQRTANKKMVIFFSLNGSDSNLYSP